MSTSLPDPAEDPILDEEELDEEVEFEEEEMSPIIKHEDRLMNVVFVWPMIIWAGSWLIHLGNFFYPLPWGWILLAQILFPILELVLYRYATTLVDPDKIGVRQIIKGKKVLTNCRVVHYDFFSQLARIPGGQIITTTDEPGGKHVLTSQVKQTTIASLKGKSDKLWFKLKIVGRLDIWKHPETVINAFFRAFRKSKTTDEALQKVNEEVLSIAVALADEALQKEVMENLVQDVTEANRRLLKAISPDLKTIGFELLQVTIEDMRDLVPGGFLSRLSEMTRAELLSQTQIATAEAQQRAISATAVADKEGRLKQTSENLVAVRAEMDARQAIAAEQLKALKAETDVKKQFELLGLQGLIQILDQVKDKDRQVFLSKVAQLNTVQLVEMMNKVAENAGLKVTGNLTLLASDVEKATGAHALGALAEKFMEMLKKMP